MTPSMLVVMFVDTILSLVILVLAPDPFTHINIATFSRDLGMTWVERRYP